MSTSSSSQPLKHDPGLALEWSPEEQTILEDALTKYANETNIIRYIKIAASLPDKTVRDVALRCRWMSKKENGKRRKAEEQNSAKKIKERKEKLFDTSSKPAAALGSQATVVGGPSSTHLMDYEKTLTFEEIGGTTGQLLEQNAKAFEQITVNLAAYRIEENINLLCHTRDNIISILNNMKDMPGMRIPMPPLPISLDDLLAQRILPTQNQGVVLDGLKAHLKQEL